MSSLVTTYSSLITRSPIRLRHLPPLTGEGWDRGRRNKWKIAIITNVNFHPYEIDQCQ
jgi:hypothetical protein